MAPDNSGNDFDTSLLVWRRSSKCSANSCVEVASLADGGYAVRDSKLAAASPVLVFTTDEWRSFTLGVRAGEFG